MAASWAPLLPEDFLVSCRDVVPGVRRLTAPPSATSPGGGAPARSVPTRGVLDIASQLEPSALHSMHAVQLSGLGVHLPDGFLEVVRKQAAGLWRQTHGAAAAAAGAPSTALADALGRLLPVRDLQRSLALRVSVHNGRRFVGPPVVCPVAALEPVEGRRGGWVLLGIDMPVGD